MKAGYDIDECFGALIDYVVECVTDYHAIPYFHEIALEFKYNRAFMSYLHDNAAFVKYLLDSYREESE